MSPTIILPVIDDAPTLPIRPIRPARPKPPRHDGGYRPLTQELAARLIEGLNNL